MKPTLPQRIRELICKIFGHFPVNPWHYGHDHADCKCCRKVLTNYGEGWD